VKERETAGERERLQVCVCERERDCRDLLSPRTRKRMEVIAIAGGKQAMARVQPRLKKQAPDIWSCSFSRRMAPMGVFMNTSRTAGLLRRARSKAQPAPVSTQQRLEQKLQL
jgi:hypothetical protein